MSDNQPPAITLAVEILRRAGWTVTAPEGPLLMPCEISDRLKLKPNTLHRRLHSPSCPAYFAEYTDAGRRIRFIRFTKELEAYLSRPLHQGTPRQLD